MNYFSEHPNLKRFFFVVASGGGGGGGGRRGGGGGLEEVIFFYIETEFKQKKKNRGWGVGGEGWGELEIRISEFF